ncbi:hypothetical protein JCM11641_001886 [Rhodosporidiobolus odoratus]
MADTPMADPDPELVIAADFAQALSNYVLFQQLVLFTYNACQYVNRAPQTLAEADLVVTTVCETFQPLFQRFSQTSPSSLTARPLIQDLHHILRNSPQGQTLVAQLAQGEVWMKTIAETYACGKVEQEQFSLMRSTTQEQLKLHLVTPSGLNLVHTKDDDKCGSGWEPAPPVTVAHAWELHNRVQSALSEFQVHLVGGFAQTKVACKDVDLIVQLDQDRPQDPAARRQHLNQALDTLTQVSGVTSSTNYTWIMYEKPLVPDRPFGPTVESGLLRFGWEGLYRFDSDGTSILEPTPDMAAFYHRTGIPFHPPALRHGAPPRWGCYTTLGSLVPSTAFLPGGWAVAERSRPFDYDVLIPFCPVQPQPRVYNPSLVISASPSHSGSSSESSLTPLDSDDNPSPRAPKRPRRSAPPPPSTSSQRRLSQSSSSSPTASRSAKSKGKGKARPALAPLETFAPSPAAGSPTSPVRPPRARFSPASSRTSPTCQRRTSPIRTRSYSTSRGRPSLTHLGTGDLSYQLAALSLEVSHSGSPPSSEPPPLGSSPKESRRHRLLQ